MKYINKTLVCGLLLVLSVFGINTLSIAQLNGTYTVGGTSPNYASVAAAVSALGAGVSGPVVFKIRNGTYTGQITINTISGANAVNTVTFESETANAANVTIQFTPTSSTSNWVVRLNNASFVTFKNVTLRNTATASFGRILELLGTAGSNNITGCVFTNFATTTISNVYASVYANALTGGNNGFTGNTFNNGSVGIYLYGTSTSNVTPDNRIDNNTFANTVYGYGIWSYYTNNLKIRNNTLLKTGAGTYYGLNIAYTNNALEITGNTITGTSVTGSNYPMYLQYINGTSTTKALIDNNTINVAGTSSNLIQNHIYYSNYYSFSKNKVTLSSTSTGSLYLLYNYNYSTANPNPYGNSVNVDDNEFTGTNTSSGSQTLYGHYYGLGNCTFNNNKIVMNNQTGSKTVYGAFYTPNSQCNNNTVTSTSTSGALNVYNAYYAPNSVASNNTCAFNVGSTTASAALSYFVTGYSNNTLAENNTITANGTTGAFNIYGAYYSPGATCNNLKVTTTNTTGANYIYGNYYSAGGTWTNSTITRNSTTGAMYAYLAYYCDNCLTDKNTITSTSTGSAVLNNYVYYSNNFKVTNNTLRCSTAYTSTIYGVYNYHTTAYSGGILANNVFDITGLSTGAIYAHYGYYNNNQQIYNNVFSAKNTSGTTYGYQSYYSNNVSTYNNAIYAKTTGTCYGTLTGYYYGEFKFYNNTVHAEGTGSTCYAGYFYNYSGSGYNGPAPWLRNNVFSRAGTSGYLIGVPQAFAIDADYNNYFTTGATAFFYDLYNGTTSPDLITWRNATGNDKNSLVYNPGYMNTATGDLRPNPANPNSWSLNGRGVQIAGNTADINNNARAELRFNGVPDLGAYEFTPTATPPNCTGVPAAPAANGTQVFHFGLDTVAVIKWGATVPTGFAIKQYTGTNPPANFTTFNPTQMYYYVDFLGNGTSLDYIQSLYYKDAWLGTIPSENGMHLAQKVGANPWFGHSPTISVANITRNFIYTTGVQDLGLFTGRDLENNAGTDIIVEPVPPFCAGTYTVKVRIKNNGRNVINNVNVTWEVNGTNKGTVAYNTPINVYGTPAGNEAIVTLGTHTFDNSVQNFRIWTSQPNNVADPYNGDDTLKIKWSTGLNGVYTVGGSNPSFATFTEAVDYINSFGLCGNTTINIRPGVYVGKSELAQVKYVGGPYRLTFQSENGNAASVSVIHSTANANDYVLKLNNASNVSIKNITFTASGATGHAISLWNTSSNDSIVGCNINATFTTSSTANASCIFMPGATNFKGTGLVIKGNKLSGGYRTIDMNSTSSNYINGVVIDGNEFTNFYYGLYAYYNNGLVLTNNSFTGKTSSNYMGAYLIYAYQSPVVTGNKFDMIYGYGFYTNYMQGTTTKPAVFNNNIITMPAGSNAFGGMVFYYPSYLDVFNNSMSITSAYTSCYGALFYNSGSTNVRVRNNVFSNTGGGWAISWYSSGTSNTSDYNLLYSTGNNIAYDPYNGNQWTLAQYRTNTQQDINSINYQAGFMNPVSDLRPDKNNPNSWAMNGRGVQIAGNNMDFNGNARIDKLVDGAPDLGAYEFTPEVLPPACVATPAVATPGSTQVFTFGDKEVATVKWNLQLPITSQLTVRQYSGEKAPGIAAAASPKGSMYFYTTVESAGGGNTFDVDIDVNYMDIWLGDIANENDLRLANKYQSNPWMVYNGTMSSVSTTAKKITGNSIYYFGSFTGLEDGTINSAFVRAQGNVIFCIGNSVQLNAEPQSGNYYKWFRNGVALSGAEGPNATSYVATQPGNYTVQITYSGKTVESVPVGVSAIAPPNALVTANGPLTYCVGNGLTLDAGTGQGLKYQWQLNSTNIPGATNNTYQVNQPGNYTVVVENIGCATTSAITPVTNGPLTVNLGADTSYCEIKNVFAKLDAGYPGARYIWSTGDTTRTIEVKQSGDYWVEVDGGPNCVDRDTINVNIDPLPDANGISYVKNGNTYSFSPSGPIGAKGFLWLFSDGTTSSQQYPTKTITGDLYVRLVMYNACGSDTVQLGWPLSVEAVIDGAQVSVYPNPATDKVTVSLVGIELNSLEVVNSVGSLVYSAKAEGNTSRFEINITNLPNGHYILRVNTSEGVINKGFDIIR